MGQKDDKDGDTKFVHQVQGQCKSSKMCMVAEKFSFG